MEVTFSPGLGEFRARLHEVIDHIQSEAVLQAALLLLLPQANGSAETPAEENQAWLRELDQRLSTYKAGQNLSFTQEMERLKHSSK